MAGNTKEAKPSGPEFVRFFAPLLDTLRELGDSGRPKEVTEKIALRLNLPESELNRTNKNGGSRFANQVAWARFYLAKAGLIDTSRRGVWTLTDAGRRHPLTHDEAIEVSREVIKGSSSDTADEAEPLNESIPPPDQEPPGGDTFHGDMATTLRSLSPEGFERLCQLLLREVGFEEVIVEGRSGDGGIDGRGTLRINRFVSDRMLFQCKRYTKQISPKYIREFRGSMAARADRGIFLATAPFSHEAKRGAACEGAAPIEMVDLEALISLMTELKIGGSSRTVLTVDQAFFREYMPSETAPPSRQRKKASSN